MMIAEHTDGFWKGAISEGKTYYLRTEYILSKVHVEEGNNDE